MATLKLNRAELIRRKQDLIRRGVRTSYTVAVKVPIKRRNTPSGASKPSAKFLKVYDPKQRALERGKRLKDVGKPDPLQALFIPKDVLLAHAVHVTRHDLNLRRDALVRPIPTLDHPKPLKRKRSDRPTAKELGLTLAEAKVYAKMKWYDPSRGL